MSHASSSPEHSGSREPENRGPAVPNPYDQTNSGPYGQAPANPYGQSQEGANPYGQAPANPYGQSEAGANGPGQAGAYGQPASASSRPVQPAGYGQGYPTSPQGAPMAPQAGAGTYGRPAWMRPSVSMMEALKYWWKNILVFNGRASRSEYWWMQLWAFIVSMVLNFISQFIAGGVALKQETNSQYSGDFIGLLLLQVMVMGIQMLVALSLLSVQIRRLHDVNKSGWWLGAYMAVYLVFMGVFVAAFVQVVLTPDYADSILAGFLPAFLVGVLVMMAMGITMFVFTVLSSNPKGVRFDRADKKLPVPQTVPAEQPVQLGVGQGVAV